ncbi:AAA family ATPase [uncultured Maribacter sp.]|uniref:AAA family ATPase n=1 Tax=uncultured Maribacter sp. TaxID=431308 RepID=UPI0026364A60|nr:AAA family ATPase [uncultured Maribacter sp.]
MKLQTAQRSQVKLRLGLSGASGFGKTYSALLLAHGITNDWTKIAIIDTENNSASLYSELGNYNVISFSEPYNPERYIKAIKTCEDAQIEVIIVDSITHEWQGTGGCLHIHEQLGGRFQDWAKVSPRHQAFIDAILQSKAHVITTVRSKIDYSMDSSSNGKTKVVKHGLKSITREGFEYELTVNFELINENHMAKASKDRTGLFMNKPEFIINSSTGRKLMQWCNQGLSVDQARKEIEVCTTLEGLRHLYQKYIGLKELIHPIIINRKADLEAITSQVVSNKEIINPLKTKEHGANS